MNIEYISSLFEFAGGIGMFLYGMNTMADGMQRSAGGKMKKLLGYLTSNRLLAIIVGAVITAIIQSSGATTVMVVGFVNAGLMTLVQAVGVIMGANIGTTITAWIVSLGQLGDAAKVMNPSFYAPFLIGIGAFVILFSKKDKVKNAGISIPQIVDFINTTNKKKNINLEMTFDIKELMKDIYRNVN